MRKIVLCLWVLLLLLTCGCAYTDPVIGSLPEYQSEAFYTSGGFQDTTDYAKYTYEPMPMEYLEFSDYYRKVDAQNAEEILLHIQNFEEWVKVIGGELQEGYDFDCSIISTDDYFYLDTKAGEPIGSGTYDQFDHYKLYYFEVDTLTLYYFHNNT